MSSDETENNAESASATEEEEEEGVPPKEILDSLLKVAIKASRAAGDLIYMNIGAEVIELKANSRDLLTMIDHMCEKVIKDIILETFPTHDFLGEEDVPPGKEASAAAIKAKLENAKSDYLWIVDPIDGTSNFVHGMPLCMPSIAVAYKGEVVVGVIFDPHRNEVFASQKGQGAYLNGERLSVSNEQTTLGDAIVAMGSPPAEESMQMSLKAIQLLMPRVRTIRMLGSAALMLAWVACGRLTCYWEYDLSSWDVAAGYLIIMEAGGSFTNLKNEPWSLTERKIVASNGHIHGEMLEVLEEADVV